MPALKLRPHTAGGAVGKSSSQKGQKNEGLFELKKNTSSRAQSAQSSRAPGTQLEMTPYPTAKGFPTYETDYSMIGPKGGKSDKRARTADPAHRRRNAARIK